MMTDKRTCVIYSSVSVHRYQDTTSILTNSFLKLHSKSEIMDASEAF